MQPSSDFNLASRAPSHDKGASPRGSRQRLWRRISEEIDPVIRRVCCLQNGWSATHRGGAPAVGGSKVQPSLQALSLSGRWQWSPPRWTEATVLRGGGPLSLGPRPGLSAQPWEWLVVRLICDPSSTRTISESESLHPCKRHRSGTVLLQWLPIRTVAVKTTL